MKTNLILLVLLLGFSACSKSTINQEQKFKMTDLTDATVTARPEIINGNVTGVLIYINGKMTEEIVPTGSSYTLNIINNKYPVFHMIFHASSDKIQPDDFSRNVSINGKDYLYFYDQQGEITQKIPF
jgi:hypothetical protein